MSRRNIAAGLVVSFCLFALTGCDPLTRNRFDMITVEVSTDVDVRATIGEPTRTQPDQWHFERPERHLNVFIDFNERSIVSRKQWIDTATNEWFDTAPQEGETRESTRIRTTR